MIEALIILSGLSIFISAVLMSKAVITLRQVDRDYSAMRKLSRDFDIASKNMIKEGARLLNEIRETNITPKIEVPIRNLSELIEIDKKIKDYEGDLEADISKTDKEKIVGKIVTLKLKKKELLS